MRVRSVLVAFLLFGASVAGAQMPTRVSMSVGTTKRTQIPFFGFSGAPQCDAAGNFYFLAEDLAGGASEPFVLRLSKDERALTYRPAGALPKDIAFSAFATAPNSGSVVLLEQTNSDISLFPFNSAGAANRVKISAPANLEVREFAVTTRGDYFVGGFFTNAAPAALAYQTYGGLFDNNGNLLKTIDALAVKSDLATLRAPHDSAVAVDSEGTIYVARLGHIFAMAPDGSILHQFAIQRPRPDGVVLYMDASDSLKLDFISHSPTASNLFEVVDPASGKVLNVLGPPQELSGNAVCLHGGYTFVQRSNTGTLTLISAK